MITGQHLLDIGRALVCVAALSVAAPVAHAAEADEAGAPSSSSASAPGPVVASAVRIAGDKTRTRFVLDLNRPVETTVFLLADPDRIVIDLPQTDFTFAAAAAKDTRGLIRAWRYGRFASGQSRIVIDTTAPAVIDKSFVLPAVGDQPARLVMDLVKTTPKAFRVAVEEGRRARIGHHGKGDRLPVRAKDQHKPLIVLDPGHGGLDTGTVGHKGTVEKAVVLAFARSLKAKLEAEGTYVVRMTRDDDTFIPLRKRVEFARDLNADLFVSIHADSVRQKSVRGASVYTLSERASDRETALLAAKENKSDIIAGLEFEEETDDVADILIDLARRETKSFSVYFANVLTKEMKSATRLVNRPQRSAGFRVLKAPDVPSVLVELGFLSNRHDETLLTSDEWRERTAEAMVVAIDRFFAPRVSGRDKTPIAGKVTTVAQQQQ